jgi:hypothetical protein
MKQCKKCGIEKPLSEFHKNKATKDGVQTYCAICSNAIKKDWRKANINLVVDYRIRSRYGITLFKKKTMFFNQNNGCDICKKELSLKYTVVDHCHITGKVRGLLCNSCNSVIGFAKDSTNILKSAILYLDKHSTKE